MSVIAIVAVGIVAALHAFFAYIEMFKWVEKGRAIVPDFDDDMLMKTIPMAANQGLYNLFLVAGLIWSLFPSNVAIATCFLLFVIVAGIFGGITIGRKLFFIQAMPALIALGLLHFT